MPFLTWYLSYLPPHLISPHLFFSSHLTSLHLSSSFLFSLLLFSSHLSSLHLFFQVADEVAEEEHSVHDAELKFVRGGTLKSYQRAAAAAAVKAKSMVVESIDIRALEALEVRVYVLCDGVVWYC